jgi:hypothetical protein
LTGQDGNFQVGDKPHWLQTELDVLKAKDITSGNNFSFLPVIYISSTNDNGWVFDRRTIEKAAFDLGGVAHIVVEPSRSFSFKVRDISDSQNVYGGSVGISLPGTGFIKRFSGWQFEDSKLDMINYIQDYCINLRTNLPGLGWDWTELQEQVLRRQREKTRGLLSARDFEALYIDEIANLKDRINELENSIKSKEEDLSRLGLKSTQLNDTVCAFQNSEKELYPGETFDRMRLAAHLCLEVAEKIGLDARSSFVFQSFIEKIPASNELSELSSDLDRAASNGKRANKEIIKILERVGYRESSEKNHIKLEPNINMGGLTSITMSKTPSDHRSTLNLKSQIKNTLGISKLKF